MSDDQFKTDTGSFKIDPKAPCRRRGDVKGETHQSLVARIVRADKQSGRTERAIYAAIVYGVLHDIFHWLGKV